MGLFQNLRKATKARRPPVTRASVSIPEQMKLKITGYFLLASFKSFSMS